MFGHVAANLADLSEEEQKRYRAVDHMQKASQMEPNNKTYQQLLRQFRQAERTYEDNAKGFNMGAFPLDKICLGLCMARVCCGIRCI